MVKRSCRLDSPLGLVISLDVDSNASADLRLASHAVHRLLHFAMTAESSFHCVGCCRQQRIVKKRQRLVEVFREQLVECFPHAYEATYTAA